MMDDAIMPNTGARWSWPLPNHCCRKVRIMSSGVAQYYRPGTYIPTLVMNIKLDLLLPVAAH